MKIQRNFLTLTRLNIFMLFLGLVILLIYMNVALAKTIYTSTHFYSFNSDPIAIQIDVKVLDNYLGDYSKYLWVYSVTNNSYNPEPGTSNGFSGFETALPTSINLADIGNVSSPNTSWITNCCSGEPVEWDIQNTNGSGILPGQKGVFKFTSLPRTPVSSNGWFHTWTNNFQNYIVSYSSGSGGDNGPEVPSILSNSLGILSNSLVDPVPSLIPTLIAARQGSIDTSALTGKGKIVDGVSADGVTEVILRIGASQAGDQFTLSLIGSSNENGALGTLSSDNPSSNTALVTAVDTPLGPMAFALYKAPTDFARSDGTDNKKGERTVNITVKSNVGNNLNIPVKILRPPVVLIHGVWSDTSTWNFFNVSGTVGFAKPQDSRFHIYSADYKQHHADGFLVNAKTVFSQIQNFITQFKNSNKVAAVQADVVAHSMGGDIARTIAILPNFLSRQNYEQGDVHKLITIDTPHLGSQFASNLLASSNFCKFMLKHNKMEVAGAVTDLAVGSTALKNIQKKTIPLNAHVIVGIADATQTTTAQNNAIATHLLSACPGLLPNKKFKDVLGDQSDLIVPANSQMALGLGYNGNQIPQTTVKGIVHTVDSTIFTRGPDALSRGIDSTNKNTIFSKTSNPRTVINLLNATISGGSFGLIKP